VPGLVIIVLVNISVELKNLRNHFFFPRLRCGILLILTLEIQLLFQTLIKLKINKIYHPLCYKKWLSFSLTRKASVLHTRLRLGFCALNDYLYRINCCNSPLCICCHQNETVKHYLLLCLRFAAQRNELLTSAAQVCGKAWLTSNDNGKLEFLLNGSVQLSFDENCLLFGAVQRFILDTCRFS
jgi:hypothetical protein